MRHLALIALLTVPLPLAAQGADEVGRAISAFEAGIICAPEVTGTNPAPDTVAGVTNIVDGPVEWVSRGRAVPSVLGMGFGAKAQAKGGDIWPVTVVVTHPPMGEGGLTRQSYETIVQGDTLSITLYQFDFDYELLPGPWVIEAYDGDLLLYRANFTVVAPQMVPELATICGFEDLLS